MRFAYADPSRPEPRRPMTEMSAGIASLAEIRELTDG